MSVRPRITRITVEVGGELSRVFDITGGDELPEAIFFGDMGVKEILTLFYIGKEVTMTKREVKNNWGVKIADEIFGQGTPDNERRLIDQSFINKIWTTPNDEGELTPIIVKLVSCTLSSGELK